MVKVRGPMMSMAASGSLGGSVVFSSWKGRPYVRELVIPSNPKSGGQVGRRALFKFLTQEWTDLSTADKATWQPLADTLVASTFNAFLSANMKRWHNFSGPHHVYPLPSPASGSDDTLAICDWEENRVLIGSGISTVNDAWGTAIFASLTAAFTPSVGNCIMLVGHDTVDTFTEYWTPPSVATWYFNMRPFSIAGILEAATGEQNSGAP